MGFLALGWMTFLVVVIVEMVWIFVLLGAVFVFVCLPIWAIRVGLHAPEVRTLPPGSAPTVSPRRSMTAGNVSPAPPVSTTPITVFLALLFEAVLGCFLSGL